MRPLPPSGHLPPKGKAYPLPRQNTFTGRLTPAMFDAVLARAIALAS